MSAETAKTILKSCAQQVLQHSEREDFDVRTAAWQMRQCAKLAEAELAAETLTKAGAPGLVRSAADSTP
jgi:hypothetical protein